MTADLDTLLTALYVELTDRTGITADAPASPSSHALSTKPQHDPVNFEEPRQGSRRLQGV
jgi:hypothetical protein